MTDKGGHEELVWSLKTGDFDEIKAKITTAEDANRTLDYGKKPLHIAADFGQTEIVEFLISKGADINATDKHGFTALMIACSEGHSGCVRLLLEKGADKNPKGPEGKTAWDFIEYEAIRALFK